MDTIEVEGLRIAYERAGQGPPLVLLHGYVTDGPTTWQSQLDDLSSDFTVVAWDAPGAGASADPPESFGMGGYVECLAGFVAGLGLGRPHVGGLSFGGALALALAARRPDVPATLVVAGGYAGWAGSLGAEATEERLRQAVTLSELTADEFVAALLPTMFFRPPAPAVVERFEAAMRAFHPAGFRALARASAEDLTGDLPRVRAPTLLVYGEEDTRAPRSVAEHLHAAIAGSTLVLLPGAGHVCTIEAPEAFNRAVREFLGRAA